MSQSIKEALVCFHAFTCIPRRSRSQVAEELAVEDLQQALEQHANGDEVLGTSDGKCKVDRAVGEVVAAHSRRCLIRPAHTCVLLAY